MRFILATAAIIPVLLLTVAAGGYRDNYGKVVPQDRPLNRGRVGVAPPSGPLVLAGILVDAGCHDRSSQNLLRTPTPFNALAPAEPPQEQASANSARAKEGFASREAPQSQAVTASGITVDKQTLETEQADVLPHQGKDLYTRQPDSSCAITGDTKAFALLTDDGRLLDLNEGGNTFAWQAVQSSTAGRGVLNGAGSPFKPRAVVRGEIRGDQLIVSSLSL